MSTNRLSVDMIVSTLKDLAFFKIISTAWKKTDMLKQVSLCAFYGSKYGEYSEAAEKPQSLIHEKTEQIKKIILSNTNIPKKLKIKLIVCFEELTLELSNWALVLASKLNKISKKRVNFCINRIVINNGYLDKKQSTLKILEDSNFLIEFSLEFLALSYVTEEELKIIAGKILNKMPHHGTTQFNKFHDYCSIKRGINKVLLGYNNSLCTVIKDSRRTNCRYHDCTNFEYVASLKDSDYLKHYCKYIEHNLKEIDFYKAAAFAFSVDSCDVESMVFLYYGCDEQHWVKLLKKYPNTMICIVLQSWRHRHLAVEWFRLVKDHYNSDMFIELFETVRLNFGYCEYDRYDMLPVMIRIFFEAPDNLKFEDEFFYHVLPDRLVISGDDIEYFCPVIEYYSEERKVQLLAKIIINFILSNKEDTIPVCLTLLPKLNLNIETYKTIIGHSEIKQELLSLWYKPIMNLKPYKDYLGYCKQLEKAFKNDEDVQLFKSKVLIDKHYILNYIDRHAHECYDFLKWCHNGDIVETEKYRSQLLSEGLIQQAYENIILNYSNLVIADEILQSFNLNHTICNLIKRETMAKDNIKKILLAKFLKTCNNCSKWSALQKQWKMFFSDEEDEKAFFQNLFLSHAGRDALIDLLSEYKLEDDLCLRSSVSNDLERFFHIKVLLARYDLVENVHEMLQNYGNPAEIGVEKFPSSLSPDELIIAREWVHFYYTTFLIILTMELDRSYLKTLEKTELRGIIADLTFMKALYDRETA